MGEITLSGVTCHLCGRIVSFNGRQVYRVDRIQMWIRVLESEAEISSDRMWDRYKSFEGESIGKRVAEIGDEKSRGEIICHECYSLLKPLLEHISVILVARKGAHANDHKINLHTPDQGESDSVSKVQENLVPPGRCEAALLWILSLFPRNRKKRAKT